MKPPTKVRETEKAMSDTTHKDYSEWKPPSKVRETEKTGSDTTHKDPSEPGQKPPTKVQETGKPDYDTPNTPLSRLIPPMSESKNRWWPYEIQAYMVCLSY